MRILMTGAGGNIGKGLATKLIDLGHELVLSDLTPLPNELADLGLSFHQLDVQTGVGLDRAADGCDLILHLPAWHGIHWNSRTEADFWRLNVDGTFWAFQAARANNISRFVFLSSQAWHGHYDKYGFTKRIGEELCEYHRLRNGVRYVAVRPADLTPWRDWSSGYGPRLLYGGVDREDVLNSIVCSVRHLGKETEPEPDNLVVNALRANAFSESDLMTWEADPIGTCERLFPGSTYLVEKYGMDIKHKPHVIELGEGASTVGFEPKIHFGTFLDQLRALDSEGGEAAVRAISCGY
jgi:NAD(P)-dependent dehydrogenase (short-subunit alcohol dehydrogenase family)